MRTYAVLGATGSTGSSLLRYLYERSDKLQVNVYVRSPSKFEKQHPYAREADNIRLFAGELSSSDLLTDCLKNVNVVFSCSKHQRAWLFSRLADDQRNRVSAKYIARKRRVDIQMPLDRLLELGLAEPPIRSGDTKATTLDP